MKNWFRSIRQTVAGRPARRPRRANPPRLEPLEDRNLMATAVLQTNLVSDLQGVAQNTDPNLINPWGIAESGGSPFWVSDNNAGVSTLYNTTGARQSLVVSIPTPVDPFGASGTPDGIVSNGTGGFTINGVDKTGTKASSGSPFFIFATEDGTIVGWNPGVNPAGSDTTKAGTFGIIAKDNSGNNFTESDPAKQTGAVYKGLALATSTTGPILSADSNSGSLLYAANFRSGQIDVFDKNFTQLARSTTSTTSAAAPLPMGAFTDPNIPAGYAPFNVEQIGGKIFVTYAKQNATKHDDAAGPHRGFVDVYNLDGTGLQRLASRGDLDSPWGMAIAPSTFGNIGGALLVGNFGDGHINAFSLDPKTFGAPLGALTDPDGEPIAIDGLWALQVGNGKSGGLSTDVYFTAGLFGETHGLFGSLEFAPPGTAEGSAESQFVTGATDVFNLAVTQLQTDLANGADKVTLKQDFKDVRAAFVQLVQIENRFEADLRKDLGLGGDHDHDHDDLDALFANFGR
jgi:uncharacterized protein (TIGR03118 family)